MSTYNIEDLLYAGTDPIQKETDYYPGRRVSGFKNPGKP
jgi:hypothetical protein